MLKIAIMLTCYERQKKINQKINDEVCNITHISNQNQNAKVKKMLKKRFKTPERGVRSRKSKKDIQYSG